MHSLTHIHIYLNTYLYIFIYIYIRVIKEDKIKNWRNYYWDVPRHDWDRPCINWCDRTSNLATRHAPQTTVDAIILTTWRHAIAPLTSPSSHLSPLQNVFFSDIFIIQQIVDLFQCFLFTFNLFYLQHKAFFNRILHFSTNYFLICRKFDYASFFPFLQFFIIIFIFSFALKFFGFLT